MDSNKFLIMTRAILDSKYPGQSPVLSDADIFQYALASVYHGDTYSTLAEMIKEHQPYTLRFKKVNGSDLIAILEETGQVIETVKYVYQNHAYELGSGGAFVDIESAQAAIQRRLTLKHYYPI